MKILKIIFLAFIALATSMAFAREYHVAVNGKDTNDGSVSKPFRTINYAAQLALPGDSITVHAGTYREWINPKNGGRSDSERIVYQAAKGEKVIIKGSEIVTGWKKTEQGVWKIELPESFFGSYNPYRDSINGDWFTNYNRIHHTGEVFLNGKSLYEKETLEKVINPVGITGIQDSIGSTFTWYCITDNRTTTIYANFHNFDPNKELVEITTRFTCFYPSEPQINYLTIDGFEICQAATQWAAPTAEQIGMVSTHWNKGWIIQNCKIHDSKCNGITLGKERSTGHNVWTNDQSLDGSLHYIEVVFRTLRNNWNKEHIGSHIVRNNEIYNCEQTGMCGSMGVAFSLIEHNYIHDIWTKRQFNGAEIAGIKFHAAIDTRILNNRIQNVGRGIWLDWMAQGTRVSKNLVYQNDMEDLFMEVNHGPTLVDNNLFLSPNSIVTQSQGGALIHNLIAGYLCDFPDPNRFTPYHVPHSTDVAGLSTIFSGDYRVYNNIFLGNATHKAWSNRYNNGMISFKGVQLPMWVSGNMYFNLAKPGPFDTCFVLKPDEKIQFNMVEEGENVYLEISFNKPELLPATQLISTETLGVAKMPRQKFEDMDGKPIVFNTDYLNQVRNSATPVPGPVESIFSGKSRIKVW